MTDWTWDDWVEFLGWVVGAIMLSALVGTFIGCATVGPGEVCGSRGEITLPESRVQFISVNLKVTCHADTAEANTAELTIKTSVDWAALGGAVVGAAVTLLAQDDDGDDDEEPPQPALVTHSAPIELGLLRCGPMLNRRWCTP